MTFDEHVQAAEVLLGLVDETIFHGTKQTLVSAAQVHASLAVALALRDEASPEAAAVGRRNLSEIEALRRAAAEGREMEPVSLDELLGAQAETGEEEESST